MCSAEVAAVLDQAAMDATAELNEQYDDADLVTRPVDEEQVSPPLRCAVLSTRVDSPDSRVRGSVCVAAR